MMAMKKDNRSFALIFSLFMVLLFVVFVDTYCVLVNSSVKFARTTGDSLRAYYVADAGLAYAFNLLEGGTNPPFNVPSTNYAVGPGLTGHYVVTVTSAGAPPWPIITILSVGTFGTATQTLRLVIQPQAISVWGYLSDSIPSYLWYITGMIVEGPAHTNGSFNIYGTPVFTGPVSQSGPAINYWNNQGPPQNNPVFESGFTAGTPIINFANATNPVFTNIRANAGLFLTGNSTVQLESNGKIKVSNAARWGDNNQHEINIPANGTIFVSGGTATVWGTLNGQLSIGCDSDIWISDNILYNQDPRTNPASTDVLGLVARNNINVTATGPQNLEIDACLVALTGSFQIPSWYTFAKGNMVQFGGLINRIDGCTGAFDPNTGKIVAGYNQIMDYDVRFQGSLIPPGFLPAQDVNGRTCYSKISLTES